MNSRLELYDLIGFSGDVEASRIAYILAKLYCLVINKYMPRCYTFFFKKKPNQKRIYRVAIVKSSTSVVNIQYDN